ncbi:coxsackievirus and adenovirus receptor homolog [Seriola dumerili]|uniref:coxsackievirus and adenovirus receptor homolog n=1 Tax=Seriola dumerili TaxID=41447 RepID=UPI000BBF0525|nr:coxsackievirus and adenovirus receptor homolog [Seriola dumerili]
MPRGLQKQQTAVSQVGVASQSKAAAHRSLYLGYLRSQSTYCLSAASHCLHRFSRKLAVINQQKKKMFSSVLTVCVCLLTCLLSCVSGEETKVKPGEDVTLQCRGPRDAEIKLITWIRPDLKSEDYVFLYRDKRLYEQYQLPSYRGRVELTDPQVKDGDVSVILKNVTINDAARYECQVGKKGSRPQLISTITLKVVDSVNVTAAPGQTVSLPCRAARDTNITVVEWSRAEPEPEQVFLYRDKNPDPQNQSPSFQNRVELRDRQMKDGDVSLTLKDVTRDDTGRYECRVQTEANSLPEPVSIIYLDVHQKGITEERGDEEGGDKEGNSSGHVGLGVGLSVAALLVVVVVGFMIYR